jgi:hypothetical protein
MLGFLLILGVGWLVSSTILGLLLGRVIARRDDVELPARSVARHGPRHAA